MRAVPFVLVLGACACSGQTGLPPPVDQPHFPTGLAVDELSQRLVIVSSDFDKKFNQGAVLVADLAAERPAIVSAALLPALGDRPALTTDGSTLFVATRGGNLLSELSITGSGDTTALSCGDVVPGVPQCGVPPMAVQVGANDPFAVVLTDEDSSLDDNIGGIVSLLSSPDVFFFVDTLSRTGSTRLVVNASLHLGDDVRGVRGLVFDPDERLGLATLERTSDSPSGVGADLAVFDAAPGAAVVRLDLTAATGSLEARDLALIPGTRSLIVLLRSPDAIARVDLFDDDAGNTQARVGGITPTCADPSSVAVADLAVDGRVVSRALVTCFANDAVVAVDTSTLVQVDAVRFFGRGPYDVAVSVTHSPPQAYVSFFLDGSVGIFNLLNSAGEPALIPLTRIGQAAPRPEDGRQ